MIEKLVAKQPRLVNHPTPLLLHDNTRPHTATDGYQIRRASIGHPPYSPNLAQTDCHFLEIWITSCNGKIQLRWGNQSAIKAFIDSHPDGFFSKRINKLPINKYIISKNIRLLGSPISNANFICKDLI